MLLRNLRNKTVGTWLVLILLAVVCSIASADEADSDLFDEEADGNEEVESDAASSDIEVISITANRRSEDLQKAAISVTALQGSFLEDVSLTNFIDIEKYTPNLQILSGGDSRSTSIRIRGIGSVGNNAGIDPSVGVFIDGIYQGRAGMSVQDLMDIESVEILRGPQGTLYGKNTAAGALKVNSRAPNYEPSAMFEYVGGNYANVEGRFTLNIPLVDEVLTTRLTGYGVTRDGYETNLAPDHFGDDINGTTRWGLRSSTLWDVTDELRVLVRGDYAQTEGQCCVADVWNYGGPPLLPPNLLQTVPETAATLGVTPLPVIQGDRKVAADLLPQDDVSVGGVSVEAELERWEHDLILLTAYRNYQSDSLLDGDFSEFNLIGWDTMVELDQFSTELRAVSPKFRFIDYVGGLYFFYSKLRTFDVLGFRADHFFSGQTNTGDNTHTTTSVAGYADANLNLSELWGDEPNITLTGGIRVGWEEKAHFASQKSAGPLGSIPTAVSGPDQFSDQSEDDTYVTGRAIIKWERDAGRNWEPYDSLMLYTSYATGYKSAGYNQLRTTGAALDPSEYYFGPEHSKSGELGLRSTWFDRMITFNMTGFYTDYRNFQALVFDGLGIRVLNARGFETYGFESELTLVPVPEWITSFTVGYTQTNYTDFQEGPQQQSKPFPKPVVQDLTGQRLDNTPLWNISLFSQYEDSLPEWVLRGSTAEVNWFVMMTYNYQSTRFLSASLDPFLRVDPTNSVDLRAGLRHPTGDWEINFWVNNVTDEDIWAIGFDVPTVGGFGAFQLPPRTFGVLVRLKF